MEKIEAGTCNRKGCNAIMDWKADEEAIQILVEIDGKVLVFYAKEKAE